MSQDMLAEQLEVKSIGSQADKIPVILLEAFSVLTSKSIKTAKHGVLVQ